ncbi:MAG TPA: RNA polymerase sigma factor SigF [Oscillatoriales cyanobacterium M59_W2019_021]|nr:RNA polymerase sigma factor SigF [Oscillatoriales cyanobacterium M4454_W2019_049]HIK50604.1 RNA polymerase sigma factor SigF [Oscillatoriales cyanobacterium M59_W2019_021]
MTRHSITNPLKNESLELLRQYRHSPSIHKRNQLVQLNIGLVRKEVHHWLHQCTESYEDLLQVGCIGLIRAIERFDIAKGHAFSSFAVPYIRGEIQHYLRDKSPSIRIPRQWLDRERQVTRTTQTLQTQFHRLPTDAEVADALGLSEADLRSMKQAYRNRTPLSLDAPVADEEEGQTSLGAMVPDRRYQSFQLAEEDRILLQQALAKLEAGTCKVLEFIFLYDLTQKETAERMGISSVTVARRLKKGLESLGQFMCGTGDR